MFSYNIPLKTNDHKHQGNDKGRFDKQRLRETGILLHSAIIVRLARLSCTDSISCMKV